MFKDGVTLSKNAWYVKLLVFAYGINATRVYKNLCPLFWMVVGTIIIFPFILLLKLLCHIGDVKIPIPNTDDVITIGQIGGEVILCLFTCVITVFLTMITYLIAYDFMIHSWDTICAFFIMMLLFIIVTMSVASYCVFMSGLLACNDYKDMTIKMKAICLPYISIRTLLRMIFKPFKLFIAMIYSAYKKACPIITWK